MARKELGSLFKERKEFIGTFERVGKKSGWTGSEYTVLLKDITDVENMKIVADHLWFNYTKGFRDLIGNHPRKAPLLRPGEKVRFRARVAKYLKGYFGGREEVDKPAEIDFKLSHPTKIARVE